MPTEEVGDEKEVVVPGTTEGETEGDSATSWLSRLTRHDTGSDKTLGKAREGLKQKIRFTGSLSRWQPEKPNKKQY